MDEAHRLLDLVADRDLGADELVARLDHLEAVERVEGAVEREQWLGVGHAECGTILTRAATLLPSMSRLDALPADQKAVLQLLLRQGKSYDDLSGLLKLDADAVRARAHDALDASARGPAASPPSAGTRSPTSCSASRSPSRRRRRAPSSTAPAAGRAWAHGVARELEPLAGDRLPELPAEAEPVEPAPAAAPAAAAGEAATTEDAADEPAAATPFAPAPSAAPRVSRRGGALLLGGAVAAIAVAVVLFLVLSGGDDGKKADSSATQAATTTSTQAQPQVRAQVNLTPPKDAPAQKALAIVQIVDVNGQQAINAVAQGLPTSNKKAAYGIWVYTSPSQAKLIGGFDKTDNKGHLVFQGALPKDVDVASYKDMLVTRETQGNPTKPGTIFLRGSIQSAAGG